MDYRARYAEGTLRLLTNAPPDIPDGETVTVSIERQRSGKSHRHQFAFVKEAWMNLPEHLSDMPWAENDHTLRQAALIQTGFCETYVVDCGTNAAAHRACAALLGAERKAHRDKSGRLGYAIGRVRGPVVQIWTPESQSYRAMGGDRFKASKKAILDWIAAQIGVTPEDLKNGRAA